MLKEKLLTEFEKNRDNVLSGQYLADLFSVSRNAIWKAINSLKEEGHKIESVPQKGYKLNKSSDVISKEGILNALNSDENSKYPDILIFSKIDSTNNEAKKLISSGIKNNTIIIAKEQTGGRGRGNHTFYSPADTGIYMSIVLKPDLEINHALMITTAAALAIIDAIKKLTGKELKLRGVNDLFYNDKKVCGILTESITDFDSGIVTDVIIGIGLNISTSEFPDEIANIATSLDEHSILKNQFIASIYNEIITVFKHKPKVNSSNKKAQTTLCYIEQNNQYLMLHRVKKEKDINKDKWVGIGGHFEEGESPDECLLREVKEETNLELISYKPRGFITFVSDEWGTEYMHLYTADSFNGVIGECDEGELCWIDKAKVYDLPIWEGDKIFFKLLEERQDYFFLKLQYEGNNLVRAILDGKDIL